MMLITKRAHLATYSRARRSGVNKSIAPSMLVYWDEDSNRFKWPSGVMTIA